MTEYDLITEVSYITGWSRLDVQEVLNLMTEDIVSESKNAPTVITGVGTFYYTNERLKFRPAKTIKNEIKRN